MPDRSSTEADQADIVTVSLTRSEDLLADSARLHIRVRGTSLVSAKMALTKAREVAVLVNQLQAVGVTADEIEVTGVGIDVSSGTLLKTSEVNYALRIACRSLEMMPDMLGVVSSQKTVHLTAIEWQYTDETERRAQWLDETIEQANNKARRIATALGVQLLGVSKFTEAAKDYETQDAFDDIPGYLMKRTRLGGDARQAAPTIDIGVNINHSKAITITVNIDYRIGGYGAGNQIQ